MDYASISQLARPTSLSGSLDNGALENSHNAQTSRMQRKGYTTSNSTNQKRAWVAPPMNARSSGGICSLFMMSMSSFGVVVYTYGCRWASASAAVP